MGKLEGLIRLGPSRELVKTLGKLVTIPTSQLVELRTDIHISNKFFFLANSYMGRDANQILLTSK